MESALRPLSEHLTCDLCQQALKDRIKNLIVQWSIVKVRVSRSCFLVEVIDIVLLFFSEPFDPHWHFYLINPHLFCRRDTPDHIFHAGTPSHNETRPLVATFNPHTPQH
jgi:hypothetical protein